MISQHKIINRILLPASYVLGWVIMYFLPRRMFNVGGDNSAEPWVLFAIVFFGLPLLLNLVLKRNGITGDKLKAIVYGSVFLAVPFILFIDSEDNQE